MSEQRGTHLPGVDKPLPPGETVLWSGKPDIGLQLRYNLPLRLAGLWLALAAIYPIIQGSRGSEGATLAHLAWVGVTALVVLAMAGAFAWMVHRTTTYAITDRRVVLAHGIALPSVLNIPLDELTGASCKVHGDGSGDISLPLDSEERLGYALLWPHARPWKIGSPEPSLRWLPDVEKASAILTQAALAAGDFEEEPEEAPTGNSAKRRLHDGKGLAGSAA